MLYVTQGVIQIEIKTAADRRVTLVPVSEYSAKHRTTDYAVLIEVPVPLAPGIPRALLYPVNTEFPADGTLQDILVKAALAAARIELTFDDTIPHAPDTPMTIVSVKLPMKS